MSFSNNKQKYFFSLSNSDLTCSSSLGSKGNEKNPDEKRKQIIKVNLKK